MLNVFIKITAFTALLLFLVNMAGFPPETRSDIESADAAEMPDKIVQEVTLIHKENEKKVDILIGGNLFTSYMYSDDFYKPMLYPIKSAGDRTITRGYPLAPRPGESEDHPHQVGLWLNYGDVNGLDFWNHSDRTPADRKEQYGTISHEEITTIRNGDDEGRLEVVKNWMNQNGEMLLKENTTYLFRGDDNDRMIDRITRLTAPGKEVALTDNKEGMLGLRMARELEHPDEHLDATGIYRSSEGKVGHDVWGTRARWMNLSGWIDGEEVSVAILDHPDNVGYPTYWHARGYGLYAANPLGMKEMSGGAEELNHKLPAGESMTYRHRIIIYSGLENPDERVNGDWEEFARNSN